MNLCCNCLEIFLASSLGDVGDEKFIFVLGIKVSSVKAFCIWNYWSYSGLTSITFASICICHDRTTPLASCNIWFLNMFGNTTVILGQIEHNFLFLSQAILFKLRWSILMSWNRNWLEFRLQWKVVVGLYLLSGWNKLKVGINVFVLHVPSHALRWRVNSYGPCSANYGKLHHSVES